MQLELVLAVVDAGTTVVAGEYCDLAQWAVVQHRKVAYEVHAMCKDEIHLAAPLVALQSVEEMIGRKLLVGGLVVEVLAVAKDLVDKVGVHLGDPLQEASLDLEVALLVELDCAYHDHHPVS